jgi:hypothetical protein
MVDREHLPRGKKRKKERNKRQSNAAYRKEILMTTINNNTRSRLFTCYDSSLFLFFSFFSLLLSLIAGE